MIQTLAGAALLGALLAVPAPAAAWGAEGHRITGLVAEGLLSADAKAGLTKLMGRLDLGAAALVLDQQKQVLAQKIHGSRHWHYDDKPVCEPDAKPASYCKDGDCASVQIVEHYRTLVDQHSTLAEKRFAVNTLVHLVGDIHQPLHVSDHDDAGGNGIQVVLAMPSGTTQHVDLHTAWDTSFVRAAFKSRDERVIAKQLLAGLDAADRKRWQKGNAAGWMAESYKIATELAYGRLPGFACNAEDFAEEPLALDLNYVNAAIAVVPGQLTRAGVRIAALLNRAFAK